jgi:Fic/DOC family
MTPFRWIERAIRADLAKEPRRRDLQIEAAAHIAVQAAIDGGALDELATPSVLPESLRFVEERETGRRIEVWPGKLRTDHVRVGRHVAPSPEDLNSWLARLDEGAPERFGRAERPVVIAALHHRLLWIHPFADGNGRTARLLSHALLRRAGVGSALWSVSRGLARHVEAYKSYLARADAPPQGALDGRGVLSDGRLADFCRFFMAACLDQVRFMRTLLSPEALSDRVREFVAAEAAGNRLDARLVCGPPGQAVSNTLSTLVAEPFEQRRNSPIAARRVRAEQVVGRAVLEEAEGRDQDARRDILPDQGPGSDGDAEAGGGGLQAEIEMLEGLFAPGHEPQA